MSRLVLKEEKGKIFKDGNKVSVLQTELHDSGFSFDVTSFNKSLDL